MGSLTSSASARKQDRFFVLFLVLSIALHLVFAGVFFGLSAFFGQKAPPRSPPVIRTKLVKLGKKRDTQVPKNVNAKPPPPKKEVPKVEPKKEVPKTVPNKTQKTPSTKDVLNQFSNKKPTDLNALINDTVGESEEGDEKGSKFGDAITGRMKANYNDKVLSLIRAQYAVPSTLTDDERVRLRAKLSIKIAQDGSLKKARLSRSSGNSANDNAILVAAKKARLPPPPIPLRAFYEKGVAIDICPVRCSR